MGALGAKVRVVGVVVAAAVLVAAGSAPAATPTCTNAAVTCFTGTAADGSTFKAELPPAWNGTLLLYSHGYVPPVVPNPPAEDAPDRAVADQLLAKGFALAGSSYASNGWAVAEAFRDQIDLLDRFRDRVGKPRRTIAWGDSMGGMITAGLIQRAPQRFDAALPMCGILGGAVALWNQNLDLEYALKTLLSASPDPAVSGPASQLQLVHITDWPANIGLATAAVTAAQSTADGRARLALAAALFPLPDWYDVGSPRPARTDYAGRQQQQLKALQFQLAFIFGFRAEVEQRAGGNPSWNVGVDYGRLLRRSAERDLVLAAYRQSTLDLRHDLRRLARGPRVRADRGATGYLVDNVVYDGRIRVPVVTMHTTSDPLVVSPHERAYRDAVRRAGRNRLLEQLYVERPGHCTFTDDERLAALDVLLDRLRQGRWPRDTGGAFTDYEPPPFLRPFDLGYPARTRTSSGGIRSAGRRWRARSSALLVRTRHSAHGTTD